MIWVAVQRFGTMILSFVSNLILARLLSPTDFGCIGMLAIFIALSGTFIDGGFGSSLVQKTSPTQSDYSTIFFWNLSLSVVLYLLIWLLSPVIASFYEISILSKILRVQALILIINSLSLVHRARLRKSLKFKVQANIDLFSAFIAAAIAIILAYRGSGVWSLVAYQLTLNTCSTVGLWLVEKWRPTMEFDLGSFKSLFRFGGYILMSDLLNTFCDNVQGLIIGKKFSPAVMGYYSQAKKLEEVPTTTLSGVVAQVVFPVFSEIKDDRPALANAHHKCILASNYINIPLMSLLIIVAYPLICFLYSDKWADSAPYFQILCAGGLANCLQSVNYQLYIASGFSKSMFKWNLLKRSVGLALIFAGAFFNVRAILWGMVIGLWFTYYINATLAARITGYSFIRQIIDLCPVFAVTLASSVVTLLAGYLLNVGMIVSLFLQCAVFLLTYLSLSYIFKLAPFELYKGIIFDKFNMMKK